MAKKKADSKQGAHFKKESSGKRNWYYRAYFIATQGKLDSLQIYHCALQKSKIPQSVDDPEFKAMMPDIWCPKIGDLDPESLIDAVYERGFGFLLSVRREYPGHMFGFESFLNWLLVKAGKNGGDLGKVNPFLELPASAFLSTRKKLPTSTVGSITMTKTLLQYKDGDCYLEVECSSTHGLLTRLYLDIDDRSNKYWIEEHYPNAYVHANAPPAFPWVFFDLPTLGMSPNRRIGYQFHGEALESVHAQTPTSDK